MQTRMLPLLVLPWPKRRFPSQCVTEGAQDPFEKGALRAPAALRSWAFRCRLAQRDARALAGEGERAEGLAAEDCVDFHARGNLEAASECSPAGGEEGVRVRNGDFTFACGPPRRGTAQPHGVNRGDSRTGKPAPRAAHAGLYQMNVRVAGAFCSYQSPSRPLSAAVRTTLTIDIGGQAFVTAPLSACSRHNSSHLLSCAAGNRFRRPKRNGHRHALACAAGFLR
jgi:hypothetical protein